MVIPSVAHVGAVLLAAGSANAALYGKTISTKYGEVVGYPAFNSTPTVNLSNWVDITVWKGIPFAASTAGENRWRAPQPAEPWNTTLQAREYGPVCPDATTNDNYTFSEDCLNLNIWSAAKSSDAKLPVVMWSYPGLSTARDALFDGAGMADKEIVFVNYNYRAGAFGWMAHPQLSQEVFAETGHNSSGNWGMLDQFAALKWIHENIAAFGGDPDHITVMGQSAGSAATYHILNSPLTKGLIKGAIIESGVRDPHDPLCKSLAEGYSTLADSLESGVEFLEGLNVSSIAAARELPYTAFTTSFSAGGPGGAASSGGSNSSTGSSGAAAGFSGGATLDGYAMPATYYETLLQGAANQVPVLTGNAKDENGAEYGLNITVATYLSDVNSTYSGEWVKKFLEMYPANSSRTASAAYNAQWTDRSKIGTWFWSQLWKTASTQPVYNYFWDHAPPGQEQGAYHESEINYVLDNLYATDKPWTTADYKIAETMNSYWANFIKNGDPNGEGLVQWTAATESSEAMVQHVGNAFEAMPVGDAAKVELYKEWFATLSTY